MHDLPALCRNEEYLQVLRPETDTSTLTRLVRALKTNTHLQKVRIFVPQDFFDDEDSWLRRRLFQTVGRLPMLQELKIDAVSGLATFPVKILAEILTGARSLEDLALWDLKLVLDNNNVDEACDLESLKSSLQNHTSLKKVTLYNCQLRDDNTVCILDPLLHGLANIPTLKQVYITAAAAASSDSSSMMCSACTTSALEHLCRSKSLQELGLWKFSFSDSADPLTRIAPVIGKTNTMKMLEFGKCHLTEAGDQALAGMLQGNTSLEELDLHLDDDSTATIIATAKALGNQNTTLKRLKLWGILDRRNQEAMVQMIRHNYSLETCRLLDADRDMSAQIDFYSGLNREGRRNFLTTTMTQPQWVEVLAGSSEDLSCVFYYLSMKPSLCQMP